MSRNNAVLYRVTFEDGFTHCLHSSWGGYAWEVAQGLFPDNPVRSVESVKPDAKVEDFYVCGSLKVLQ